MGHKIEFHVPRTRPSNPNVCAVTTGGRPPRTAGRWPCECDSFFWYLDTFPPDAAPGALAGDSRPPLSRPRTPPYLLSSGNARALLTHFLATTDDAGDQETDEVLSGVACASLGVGCCGAGSGARSRRATWFLWPPRRLAPADDLGSPPLRSPLLLRR